VVTGLRALGVGLLAGGAWIAVAASGAEPAGAPAGMGHGAEGVACYHCHADPHRAAVGNACQDCHTSESWSPSTFTVARHAETKFPLVGAHAAADCTLCHPNAKLADQPLECAGCHLDRHRGKLGTGCAECHGTEHFAPVDGFDHAGRTGFALTGPHDDGVACDDCHAGARGRALLTTVAPDCATCHAPGHGDFGACAQCHADQATFAGGAFDHRGTGFPLERRHAAQACATCHPVGSVATEARSDCATCHVDVHAGQLSTSCSDCHRPDRWRLVRFDHDAAWFPLRGAHFVTACTSCHTNQRWLGLPRDCFACHSQEARLGPRSIPAHVTGVAECEDCHGTWTW
jgi:hypothetical protein